MGDISVKIKLMPSSVETNLEEIKEKSKAILEEKGGKNVRFEEEPIAFGLKAIIVFFIWSEEKELESIEKYLEKIENVNSLQVLDIRKTIG
ncbi:MAG: elongation factor 1-beta [Nanoarchaeota archaeon]|nr:elongation factor 1-beta [Nanoarchaeota archaeon]